ncbi:hypothetical protein [Rhizobium sp. SG2393]|uniref:hypothetical protein n=1 Tax=Rhizobium sp. SG2393 TaxID=3276279 RepID=UPI00366AD5DE
MKKLLCASAFLLAIVQPAHAGDWDGSWSGKWGGKSSALIKIKNDKVVAYYFNGAAQSAGTTKVKDKTLSFGSDYSVALTRTGPKTASAFYKGRGTAKATLTLQ